MKLLHDRASMMRGLIDLFDPTLARPLADRIIALSSGEFDLLDLTEILIVEPGDTEADIISHVGFSPLVNPIDGVRFGQPGFQPFWDWLIRHPGWWELCVSFGSAFAYIIFIKNAEGMYSDLKSLCNYYS